MNRMLRHPLVCLLMGFAALQVFGYLHAQSGARPPRRAKRPTFVKRDVERVFYADVFSKLVGERPANLSAPGAVSPSGGTPNVAAPGNDASAPKGKWAAMISSSTIEDEIKRIKISVDKDVTTPSDFAGRGYKACRVHFTMLAGLFGAVHEYDGDIRFQKSARSARDLFARTAANAKVGTPQVYNEAKLRKQDLQDIVSGSQVESKPKPEPPTWGDIVERGPLMQRLEDCLNVKLNQTLASEAEFKSNSEEVFHEAEILAFLSAILTKEGLDDADDEDYAGYANTMRDAAREIVEGVKLNDYDRARKAAGVASQACDECHELYRG